MQSFDMVAHLKRQIAFSRGTFGPGERREGVIAHIRKELDEVLEADGDSSEWVDVVILAFDGLTRRLVASGASTDRAAEMACELILLKQGKNERRDWPDWRTSSHDKPIEHIKEGE